MYLHIANEQRKQHQPKDRNADGKENLREKSTCFEVLAKRAEERVKEKIALAIRSIVCTSVVFKSRL